jgi:sulfonate transport system substrate-binding protein
MRKTIVAALLLAALLLTGCPGQSGTEDNTAGPPPRITIGHVGHDHQIALYVVALAPEMFKERGGIWLSEKKAKEVYDLMDGEDVVAELHLVKVGGGSAMPAAMERGEIDVGLGGIPAVMSFVDKGANFKILAPLNVDGDMLVVRPDFPADDWDAFIGAVRSAKKPVRIGYKAPVAVAKLVFAGALDAAGVPVSDTAPPEGGVELVNLQGGKNIVPALESGTVDGAVINEPFGSIAVDKGVGKIVSLLADLPPDGKWKSHPCCCVCATEATVSGHREVLKKLLAMMLTATDYIHEDPTGAAKLAAKWTKKSEAVESRSVPNIVYVMVPGESYRNGLATWHSIMVKLGTFSGRLKDLPFDQAFALGHDLTLIQEVSRDR